MTSFRLVRHGRHALQERILAGRSCDVGLDAAGMLEADDAARKLCADAPVALVSSPRRRALDTAASIARRTGLAVTVERLFDEVDFGAWSGTSFVQLAGDPRWRRWNAARSDTRCPDGETMREVALRMEQGMGRLAELHPGGCVVVVSHAEPIRAVLLKRRGAPFDAYAALDVPTGCVIACDFHARRANAEEDVA